MTNIYLDYAATTYVEKPVIQEMIPYLEANFSNPSGSYASARVAKKALEQARDELAVLLNLSNSKNIHFTPGGTEANNWALRGIAAANKRKGKHIITTNAEHPSILSVCKMLESEKDYQVTYIPVNEGGVISAEQVRQAIRPDTILVSVMLANNEVGAINPVREISEVARTNKILFHTDAVAAAGHILIDANIADMVSMAGHKFYGPKGTGVLVVADGVDIAPATYGGNQEQKKWAGTENVAGIIGLVKAYALAIGRLEQEEERLLLLRTHLETKIIQNIPNTTINGYIAKRLNSYSNICFPMPANVLLIALDRAGIECSAGAACMAGGATPSHVLRAMGRTREEASSALRFTMGARTTIDDIECTVKELVRICK